MNNRFPQVPAGTSAPGVANATPQSNSPVAAPAATPAAPAEDAAALEALRQQKAQLEQDVRNIKSTFQRKETELTQQLQRQQAEFERQMREIQMAGMDEEQRKLYDQQYAQEQVSALQRQLDDMRRQSEDAQGKMSAFQFFREHGVPAERLDFNVSLEEMVQGGYDYLAERNAQLEALLAQQAQAPTSPATPPAAPVAPAPLPTAPRVDLGAGASVGTRPTWDDIDREYAGKGGREKFYEQLQAGEISSDRLPLTEQK